MGELILQLEIVFAHAAIAHAEDIPNHLRPQYLQTERAPG
nr:uncharacterized protein CTRU02_03184 [Colletotrichum truncatum]KAF6797153.1 hypothetical protein CTRU02_03184 [Colletotrichum truncatum]